ncbi:hypothetical protein SSTU70S_04192 [Stutzerimonas stutzeri]
MQAPKPTPELDDATLAFAEQVFDCARQGDSDRLSELLAQGLPANLRNHAGDSLLMLASYHGHLDTVRLLLQHGADPQLRNARGQTPLAGAAFKGDLPMIRLLLEHGADVEGASPDGRTALMIAAMFNRSEIVEFLIAQGADPHARDAGGATALAAAAMMGAADTQALLAQADALVQQIDFPWRYARALQHLERQAQPLGRLQPRAVDRQRRAAGSDAALPFGDLLRDPLLDVLVDGAHPRCSVKTCRKPICRIPDDHMVSCETNAGAPGTNPSWPAQASCS